MGWRSKLQKARKLHRPDLKDWQQDGMYEEFPAFVDKLAESEHSIPCDENAHRNLPIVLDAASLPASEFFEKYEAKELPCVIQNIPYGFDNAEQTKPWPAVENWSLTVLEHDQRLGDRKLKCGEDDDGRKIKVKLRHFMSYLRHNRDDSPLYIFDATFDEDKTANRILDDYVVPSYFRDDLFRFVSESRRPPYRWFLVGPERSGTCVHIDPLGTSAWNTLIHGRKRWVLFPPHVPKCIVKGKGLIRDDEDDEAVHYFMNILPRIKRKAATCQHHNDYQGFACYEFTQHAGETVFIPSGWWHAVLNLTHTVGCTQNFCSPRNFDIVWKKTRTGRKRMAWKLLCQLDHHYPHLAERARQMNEGDSFRMKYDPEEIRCREEKERRHKMRRTL